MRVRPIMRIPKFYFSSFGESGPQEKFLSTFEFLTRLETRLENNLVAMRAELKADQLQQERRLEATQRALKEDLAASQQMMKDNLDATQKAMKDDLRSFQTGNNYKLIVQLFGVVFAASGVGIAVFNSLGFEINHSWKNSPKSS